MKTIITLLVGAVLGVGLFIKFGDDVREFRDTAFARVDSHIRG